MKKLIMMVLIISIMISICSVSMAVSQDQNNNEVILYITSIYYDCNASSWYMNGISENDITYAININYSNCNSPYLFTSKVMTGELWIIATCDNFDQILQWEILN
jgi:hypothetical protein